jgi:hypothetical protein
MTGSIELKIGGASPLANSTLNYQMPLATYFAKQVLSFLPKLPAYIFILEGLDQLTGLNIWWCVFICAFTLALYEWDWPKNTNRNSIFR